MHSLICPIIRSNNLSELSLLLLKNISFQVVNDDIVCQTMVVGVQELYQTLCAEIVSVLSLSSKIIITIIRSRSSGFE